MSSFRGFFFNNFFFTGPMEKKFRHHLAEPFLSTDQKESIRNLQLNTFKRAEGKGCQVIPSFSAGREFLMCLRTSKDKHINKPFLRNSEKVCFLKCEKRQFLNEFLLFSSDFFLQNTRKTRHFLPPKCQEYLFFGCRENAKKLADLL